ALQHAAAAAVAAASAQQQAAPFVHVTCGGVAGVMVPSKQRILIDAGGGRFGDVGCTEFERLGGKAAHKRWRSSIRLANECGPTWGEPPARRSRLRARAAAHSRARAM
ncbi:hypothetical protein MNEG_16050, partial [Monoraphidium neglectum]